MLAKLLPETARFMGTVMHYRSNPVASAGRFLHLYRHRRFSPNEIHFLNLLDPALSADALQAFVSKEELLQVQRRLNDERYFAWTEDKITFTDRCVQAGLPVPKVYAIHDAAQRAYGRLPLIHDAAGLDAFLASVDIGQLIVKPIDGVHGEGVMRIERRGGDWRLSDGRVATAAVLRAAFVDAGYERWMFQERIVGHDALCQLSATTGLQTLRMVTLIDATGRVQLLSARLRLICNDGVQDNFDFGRTGNLVANIDLASGRIRDVVGRAPGRAALRDVDRHPRTGQALIGVAVPQWDAAQALAHAAADAFRPLRTIGWDVAITPDAPRLIEGNVTWDTLIGEKRMGAVYAELCSLAASVSS